jgi:hypothetical protein
MKRIKAILRMISGGTGISRRATPESESRATYRKLFYQFSAVKPGSKQARCEDRVSWIGGNLGGYGIVTRKASLMAIALDIGHKHLSGRRVRHVILSCEPCDGDRREDAERRLIKSAPLLAALLGADRWIAVIHRDTAKPHMHLIIMNYDPRNDRRLEFPPQFLSKIQDMSWTPYFDSGKGARMGGLGARGQVIQELKVAKKKEDPADRNRALEKLYGHMEKQKVLGLRQDAMALWLAGQCEGRGWDGAKLLTRQGIPRKNPVVRIDGINLRMRFFRWFVRQRAKDRILSAKALGSTPQKPRSPKISKPEFPDDPV